MGEIKKAVICAGGLGRRLSPLTDKTNKHLLPIGGELMIERLVRQLVEVGITDIGIGLNGPYTKGFSELFFSADSRLGEYVTLIESGIVGGPGRTVLSMREFIGKEPFICVMGDSVFFDGFPMEVVNSPYTNAMGVVNFSSRNGCDEIIKYAQIGVNRDKVDYLFGKKDCVIGVGMIQVPVYRFSPYVLDIIEVLSEGFAPNQEVTMTDIAEILISGDQMCAMFLKYGSYIDAGTPKAYELANKKV